MITPRTYNRSYQRRLIKYSSRFAPLFEEVIVKDFKDAAEMIEKGVWNVQPDPKPYLKAIYKLYINVGLEEAVVRHNQFVKLKKNNEELLYDWGNYLRNHVELQLGNRVTKIADTTRDQIKQIIEEGLKNGDGYDKIARSLRKATGDEALKGRINVKARALMIARTEGTNAANLGALRAAYASGIMMQKTWLHGYNARRKNRTAHILLGRNDGIPLDRPFMVNGKLMQYPGDPAGGAAEVVNCKCTLYMEPVKVGGMPVELTQDRPETMTSRIERQRVTNEILREIEGNVAVEIPPVKPVFVPARTVKEAEEFAVKEGLAKKVNYRNVGKVEYANTINETLLKAKEEHGIKYDVIKTVNQQSKNSLGTIMTNNTVYGQDARSELVFNAGTFEYLETKQGKTITEFIKENYRNGYWVGESLEDLINHEIGHFLTSPATYSASVKMSKDLRYERVGVSTYGKAHGVEALAEIWALYKKSGISGIPKEWIEFFNKYSSVKIQ